MVSKTENDLQRQLAHQLQEKELILEGMQEHRDRLEFMESGAEDMIKQRDKERLDFESHFARLEKEAEHRDLLAATTLQDALTSHVNEKSLLAARHNEEVATHMNEKP